VRKRRDEDPYPGAALPYSLLVTKLGWIKTLFTESYMVQSKVVSYMNNSPGHSLKVTSGSLLLEVIYSHYGYF